MWILLAQGNRLSGTLPPEWAELSSLAVMGLNNNRLKGTLPAAWGKLPSLFGVLLSDNTLTGTLPPTWRMGFIYVAWNNLTGSLPPSWGAATLLHLAGNNLSGSIPAVWGEQAKLSSVSLNNNSHLEGCLPRAWRSLPVLLPTTQPGERGPSWDEVMKQTRADQARRADEARGTVEAGIVQSFPSFALGGARPAVTTESALQGTRLTGYC